jgi:ADP-ribose pyrophosphatase
MKYKKYLSSDIYLINKRYKKNQYYHFLKETDNVVIIPCVKNKFIIVKQKRIPIRKKNFEFPCGRVDRGETNIQSACRELLEETGYQTIKPLKKLVTFFADPGRNTRSIHCYFTKNLKLIKKPEKGIKIFFYTKEKIQKLILQKKFNSSFNIAAFYFLLKQKKYYS